MLGRRKRKSSSALERVEHSAKILEQNLGRAREMLKGPMARTLESGGETLEVATEKAIVAWKAARKAADEFGEVASRRLTEAGELVVEGGQKIGQGMQEAGREYQRHPQRTHAAGVGGLVGGVVGALAGPLGAAVGAAAGAAAGTWIGEQLDQD